MRIWAAIFLGMLAGCAPTNPEAWMTREKKACLPVAISMAEGLRRQGIQARVVRYSLEGRSSGHAVTAYLYPPGRNTLWTYDFTGSWRTRAFWDDARGIANAAARLRGEEATIQFAEFLD